MDIVLIFNGLGNQMSQYAFYLSKKKSTPNCIPFYYTRSLNGHNGYELGRLFGINCSKGLQHDCIQFLYRLLESDTYKCVDKLKNFIGLRKISEARNYDYDPKMLLPHPQKGINFFWGGWHSEKNFISIKDEVTSTFHFPSIADAKCLAFAERIMNAKESVSLHVRRGDYLTVSPNSYYQLGGVATPVYYKKAIERILSEKINCSFFVFSDDLEWCKKEFVGINAQFVDCNKGYDSWRDMYLMTLCKNHINANSTFSWWGAWLAKQNGITICPKEFIHNVNTKDFYPDSWIKI